MKIERDKHFKFLEDELRAETEVFNKKFSTKADFLLKQSEEMFLGQFLGFKNGEMIMKFPNSRTLPRKGEFLYCMLLPKNLRNHHNWNNLTYEDLYKERYKGTECCCIWMDKSNEPDFSLVAFNRVEIEFSDFLCRNKGQGVILVFAPQKPPIEYITNLQKVVCDTQSEVVSKILDTDFLKNEWSPILIKQRDVSSFVYNQLSLEDTMILQGPPGTGKTFMIAELCYKLCSAGKSVLVTALTNRALMEIAEKPALKTMLDEGRIIKTNMTTDECIEVPSIVSAKRVIPVRGALMLSTFFITSGYAAELLEDGTFDYVVMDEASQALLAMFAVTMKIGKVNLWVGDIRQLSPIVSLNEDLIESLGYTPLVNGLKFLTDSSSNPIYQLTETFRFGQRSANFTGFFYNGSLFSGRDPELYPVFNMSRLFDRQGGPSLLLTDMPVGEPSSETIHILLRYIVGQILNSGFKKNIAILSCFIRSVKSIQKSLAQYYGTNQNIVIDTIARVQGLTTDITILVIPAISYVYSLEPHLFNVATSRAREHTIIIADKEILKYPSMDTRVRLFLNKLQKEKSIYISGDVISAGTLSRSGMIQLLD